MSTEALFGLALYLTTRAGERIERDELLTTFWDTGSDVEHRHALRQLLYRLRQKGFELDEDGDWVSVDPARLQSDLRDALTPAWIEQATAAQVDDAAAFGPAFSRRMSPAFLAWVDEQREQLATQHRKASLAQIVLARREGRWADLERWAQSVLKTDPLNEEATLARAESAAMGGSKVIAMEILDTYLSEVWDIDPELGKPAMALRKRLAERRADWSYRGPREVALVGRTDLMTRLTGLVDAAWKGDGSAVVLVGAPGIGKTRLAMETRAYAELKGMRTVVVRAEAGMVERPLAIALELASSLLESEGALGCDPDSLALVRRIVRQPESEGPLVPGQLVRSVTAHFSQALRNLSLAIQHERRLLVLVDDIQNADPDSMAVLGHLIRSTRGCRIVWIATSRSKRISWGPEASGSNAASMMRVPPLTDSAAAKLAETTVAAHMLAMPTSASSHVAATAGGNPLFVRELSLARARTKGPAPLPDSLSGLITDRLGRLSPDKLRTLRVVALLGGEANPSRVAKLCRNPEHSLADAIEELEEDGLLSATANGVLHLHDCWQDAVLQNLAPATYAVLAHECAAELMHSIDSATSPRTLWRTAELLKIAGEHRTALTLFLRAADSLFLLGFPEEAGKVLENALPLAEEEAQRSDMLVRIGTAHLSAGNPQSAIDVAERVRLSPSKTITADQLKSLAITCEAKAKLCLDHTISLSELVDALASKNIGFDERLSAALVAARLTANSHLLDLEARVNAIVLDLLGKEPNSLPGLLARVIYLTERGPREELDGVRSAIRSAVTTIQHPSTRSMALRVLAHSFRVTGDADSSFETAREAYDVATRGALPDDAAISAELLAYICLDRGDLDSARGWISAASTIRSRPEYQQRSVAIGHAQVRLALQEGQFGEVARSIGERIDDVLDDPVDLSRGAELATLAAALIELGDEREATQMAELALEAGTPMLGLAAGDYIHELAARTLAKAGSADRAMEIAQSHVRIRNERFARPVAPFFSFLASQIKN